jgi:hypothetical protein
MSPPGLERRVQAEESLGDDREYRSEFMMRMVANFT